jgi:quinoprotein glucose dehydrogenase
VYLFNRVTGDPLFPFDSRQCLNSSVPGEVAAERQSLPAKPAPFARQILTEQLLTQRTPEAHRWAVERFRTLRGGGQFVPLAVGQETIIFPGFDGGAEWGGAAFDPETGLLFVNANDIAWTSSLDENRGESSALQLYLRVCAGCHGDNMTGASPQIPSLVGIGEKRSRKELVDIIREGAGRMPGFPDLEQQQVRALVEYLLTGENKELVTTDGSSALAKYRFTGYHKFLDPEGYPAVAPPWGTLNAINLNTGEYAWKVPLGEYPELAAHGMKATGSENYGGPIVTGGGLVFIGATNFDRKFRAFDKLTGELLWETTLPQAGNATPATYEAAGRQFVVIYATGGKGRADDPKGATYVAFALPEASVRRGK